MVDSLVLQLSDSRVRRPPLRHAVPSSHQFFPLPRNRYHLTVFSIMKFDRKRGGVCLSLVTSFPRLPPHILSFPLDSPAKMYIVLERMSSLLLCSAVAPCFPLRSSEFRSFFLQACVKPIFLVVYFLFPS